MIIIERPPNFELILKAFPNADKPGVIFAYGEYIYNPSGITIPPALLAHEAVHQRRQFDTSRTTFMSPDHWWEKYIGDHEFRYREELASHAAEYKAQAAGLDRNYRAKLLQATALRLIAPLYNYQPPRSLSVATRDLRQEIDR